MNRSLDNYQDCVLALEQNIRPVVYGQEKGVVLSALLMLVDLTLKAMPLSAAPPSVQALAALLPDIAVDIAEGYTDAARES